MGTESALEQEMYEFVERAFNLANKDFLKNRIDRINSVFDEYGIDNFYVSYSGGKDSSVLSKLIDLAVPGNNIPRVFVRTGLELNSVVDFVKEQAKYDSRIYIIRPSVNVRTCLEEGGYPFKSKIHSRKVDVYQRNGITKGVKRYLEGDGNKKHFKFICPEKLKYQFTSENKLRITAKCCVIMKEEPLSNWRRKMGFRIGITGIRQEEGGGRTNVQCLSMRSKEKIPRFFNPLSRASDDFMEWFCREYNVELPKVYYPPYNFPRTGCKGCPFAINLQNELDVLEKYFPQERKQCELIWKPVYDEYRRIGFRLRKEGVDGNS